MELWCLFLLLGLSSIEVEGREIQSKIGNINLNDIPHRSVRIAGGQEAVPHSHPWHGSLQFNHQHVCSALLLNQRWGLVPAHCVYAFQSQRSSLRVVFGEHSLTQTNGNEQYLSIAQIIISSTYDGSTLTDDYAFIQFSQDVAFNNFVQPAELAVDNIQSGNCQVAGWGQTYVDGPVSDVLLETTVDVIDNQNCLAYWTFITNDMLCAGTGNGSPCMGDSGSPLLCNDVNGDLKVFGIVTFGGHCGAPNIPEGFIRISSFHDELVSVISGGNQQCDIKKYLRHRYCNKG
ncbi:elastase-1-like [Glandiceps talaboti]